jgi:lipopolysaccharide export LptBFGC system permease protein LptF
MMVAVFAALLLALLLDRLGRPRPAMVALGIGFGLAVGLFLFEVYSPDYGFRMPWLQGMFAPVGIARA